MNDYTIQGGGNKEEFSTGSKRDTQTGKPRFDLVPAAPLTRLAMHYTNGAEKYGEFNWQKGQPIRRYLSSLLRHAQALLAGYEDEDHAAAVAWNSFAIMWTREQILEKQLPEYLEDVFSGIQFLQFYGRPRKGLTNTVSESIPADLAAEVFHAETEARKLEPFPPPVTSEQAHEAGAYALKNHCTFAEAVKRLKAHGRPRNESIPADLAAEVFRDFEKVRKIFSPPPVTSSSAGLMEELFKRKQEDPYADMTLAEESIARMQDVGRILNQSLGQAHDRLRAEAKCSGEMAAGLLDCAKRIAEDKARALQDLR